MHAVRKFGYAGTKGVIKVLGLGVALVRKGLNCRGETNLNDNFCMLLEQGAKRRMTNYG